ncbi:MAG: glycosyltransferase family 39 protein, partial [Acidimicrobiales bacterium]
MSAPTRDPELLIGPYEPTNMREDIGALLVHRRTRLDTLLLVGGTLVVAAGVFLRFWEPSALWLDEALSVNIASLPLTQIPHALSHDGAPPLFYVLLHFWMIPFGTSDFAARALAGVTSVVALPFFWHAGRRLGGRTTAWVTFFLAAASPFAINYATTVRMYSLMMLLSVLGYLALSRALESPTRNRLIGVGLVTAAILYTHYWGLFLVAVTMIWLGVRIFWERRPNGAADLAERLAVRKVFGAVIIGSLAFLPWAPVFVF